MESAMASLNIPFESWFRVLDHPLWMAAVILTAWQYIWKSIREHRLYGARLDPPTPLFLWTLLAGIAGGVLLSFATAEWEFHLKWMELWWVWTVALFLACFRLRFACFAYAAGILSLLALTVQNFSLPAWAEPNTLQRFDVQGWLLLVGGMHGVEWLLVRLDGERGSTPVVVKDHTGRWVGGYLLQKIWPLPLFVPTPAGWLPVPAIVGFTRMNLSRQPRQQKRRSSSLILLYALTMLALVAGSVQWQPLSWAAAAFSVFGHEALYRLGRRREQQRLPLFAPDSRGVKVLAVHPGSPAEAMGIKPGEVVHRVNGTEVWTLKDLEQGVQKSPAFCKLEILDETGETKLAQRPLFEGDPGHLGIVEVPRERRNGSFLTKQASGERNTVP